MQHVAIMKQSWHLTEKILNGDKIIESRWYKTRHQPWDNINMDDIIYFKDSGKPISIRGNVAKVKQFSNLTPTKVSHILDRYGFDDGIMLEELNKYKNMFKDKKYCILIYLKNIRPVTPFQINKKGFGNMAAWITIDDIAKIVI